MKYLVQSTAVLDLIQLPGKADTFTAPGGAGLYALAGMKVWENEIGIVTGVGEDYLSRFGSWYESNGLSTTGLLARDLHTPQTRITYFPDGEREETPVYGPLHYRKMEATAEDLIPFCKDTKGVYIFKSLDSVYWKDLLALKRKYGFAVMWEIAADAALPDNLSEIRALCGQIEVFSINKAEALALTGAGSITAALDLLRTWGMPLIYLRLGSQGVCLIQPQAVTYVPSVPDLQVVDATGGGNSSSGGAFIGFCRGYAPEEIGAMGNVSASFCIGQWGPPPLFDTALSQEAEKRKRQVLRLCRSLPFRPLG